MSWSTSVTADDGVLTDELVEKARDSVRTNLDKYAEHDTFDAAIAAFGALAPPEKGHAVIYSFSGHASSTSRNVNASYSVQP